MTHYNALKSVRGNLESALMKKVCDKVNGDIWDITKEFDVPLFDDLYAVLRLDFQEPMGDQTQILVLRHPK